MPDHSGTYHFEVHILDVSCTDHTQITAISVGILDFDLHGSPGYHGCQVVLGFLRIGLSSFRFRCVNAVKTDTVLFLLHEQGKSVAVSYPHHPTGQSLCLQDDTFNCRQENKYKFFHRSI